MFISSKSETFRYKSIKVSAKYTLGKLQNSNERNHNGYKKIGEIVHVYGWKDMILWSC